MFGVLNTRPNKIHFLTSLSHYHCCPFQSPIHFTNRLRHHSTACGLSGSCGAASSIWHAIQPHRKRRRNGSLSLRPLADERGEGSWNIAWDARLTVMTKKVLGFLRIIRLQWYDDEVVADGRCLFRAITHGACLRNREEPPHQNRQTQLTNQLRSQVVDELLKRRKEIEWFIEEDFDEYIQRIQQPYVWGGEPELSVACHVLKMSIPREYTSIAELNASSGQCKIKVRVLRLWMTPVHEIYILY